MPIHPTALVHPNARLGRDVTIGPQAIIEEHVEIGDGCVIGPRASVLAYTTLGPGCRLHTGAVLGDIPQDLGFKGERSYLRVGAGCIFREYVTVHRGTGEETETVIGDHCFIMGSVHLAHNVHLGRQVIIANATLLAGHVEVGDRAFISGAVVVHQFVRIGRVAMLGGACAVGQDVPPFCTVEPMQGNLLSGLNVVGMKRAGLTLEQRAEVKEAFRLLYRSDLTVSEAVARIRERFPEGSPAREMADFVAASKRGICKLSRNAESDDSGME
mgnify:CR=1 FL=1